MSESLDLREQLYNDRQSGPADRIQLPREAVTRLWGLMIDLDPDILKPNPWFPPAETPEAFHTGIAPALERHHILRYAEIRFTGQGLHAIVWFVEPVDLMTAADQQHWNAIHEVLASTVPSDSAAPTLIGLTRPIGSTNSKTGGVVRTLKAGTPISASALEEWVQEVATKPFETIGLILFGATRISPCPYCNRSDSYLELSSDAGTCYGACGSVQLKRLFEPFVKVEEIDSTKSKSRKAATRTKKTGRKNRSTGRSKPKSRRRKRS
jgi:hypothetical protein